VRRRHLVHVVSLILLALSGALGLTFLVALAYGDGDAGAFAVSGAVLVIVGLVGYWRTRLERDLTVREGYAVVSLAWLAVGAAGDDDGGSNRGALPACSGSLTTSPWAPWARP